MASCRLHLSECSNCAHPLHSASVLKRSQHTVWPCIKKPQLRLRLETSCSLKKDASFEEQGKPIGNVNGIHGNVPLRLGTSFEGEMQKIEEPPTCSEVRYTNGMLVALESCVAIASDTNGTVVAPESHVPTASDTNGTLVAPEDTNGTLVAPESRVATARDMNDTLVAPKSRLTTARIDWIGMSNEEFKKRIKEMAQSPLPRSHLMSEEEFVDFCIRREEMLYQAGKMVSKFYQDVDLPAQLRQLRGEQLNESDTVSLEHGTVARKKDVAKVKRTKKSSLDNFRM